MDDLDRLYHRLLDSVRESAPHLRERRFRLGDIPQHLLPYRLHRRELGFDSVQQYEGALARLAAGERGYLSADAQMQQAFRRAVDGGDGRGADFEQLLRQHGDALVAFAPEGRTRPETPAAAAPAVGAPAVGAPAVSAQSVSAAPAPSDPSPTPPAGMAGVPGGLVIPIVRVDESAAAAASAEPAAASRVATPPAGGQAAGGQAPNSQAPAGQAPAGQAPADRPAASQTAATPPASQAPASQPPVSQAPAGQPAAPSAASAPVARPAPAPSASPSQPSADVMPFPVRPPTPVVGGQCRNCGRPLPADRGVTFCPYCGDNLTIRRCPACSTELEAGWRFCITCGREVDDVAPAGSAPAGGAAGGASP